MAAVFTGLFNLAMRLERENFLGARHYQRTDQRRGYANGVKPKRIDNPDTGSHSTLFVSHAGAADRPCPTASEKVPRSPIPHRWCRLRSVG